MTVSYCLLLSFLSLQTSKEDLLQADFEGALKFFRVQLPKRYRAAENARRLMEQACNIKVRTSTNKHMHLLFHCPLFTFTVLYFQSLIQIKKLYTVKRCVHMNIQQILLERLKRLL